MINEVIYILPVLTVLIAALALMFMSMYDNKFNSKIYIGVSTVFLLIAIAFAFIPFGENYSVQPYESVFNNVLTFDSYSNFFNLLLISSTILTLLIGEHYFDHRPYFKGEFFTMILFSLFGMMLLANSNELVTAYVALEVASFAVYIMVGYNSDDNKRVEAIFKYLVLGSFIGAFYLLGVVLVYGATQTTNIVEIALFIENATEKDMSMLYIGLTLILFTFLFKISAVPFQAWVLDVYRGAPMIVTAFMASIFKVAIFSFFLRLVLQGIEPIIDFWDNIIYIITIFTLVFGTWLAITQKIIKRMLAASSIVHTGYLLLAFIAIGQNIDAADATVFYLIAYLLSALGSFGLITHIISEKNVRVTYDDFKGLAKQRPYLAAIMTIFMFSLAGIPSTVGFIAKFYVFTEAINAGFAELAILAILATFVSIYYYFKVIAMMYFYEPNPKFASDDVNDNRVSTYAISYLGLLILIGGIGSAIVIFAPVLNIDTLINLTQLSIMSLFT